MISMRQRWTNRRILLLAACVAILAGGYRWLSVAASESGGGVYADDAGSGRRAGASDHYRKRFWGGDETWVEFVVEDRAAGRRLHWRYTGDAGCVHDWRVFGKVTWSGLRLVTFSHRPDRAKFGPDRAAGICDGEFTFLLPWEA